MRKLDKITKKKEQEALQVARLSSEFRLEELRQALEDFGNISKSAGKEKVSISPVGATGE